ncbi:HAD-IC family P-type ATPase [Schaalia sp. JY-X159]|uniref:heavy metal translocating P-type ATPase n=1 Tax=Schaalia sp. JY-X159 TaxID=2758575 RepID=UPI00165E291C|nr:HAD-IC family P-type ATPase [Schaalia sp. JY-X159]
METLYDSTPRVGEDASARAQALRTRFFVALPLGIVIMVVSMVQPLQFPGWQWVIAALTLPVVTWCAWPFHKAAFMALRHGSTTMDTLVSLGIIASAGWSYWALFFGGAGEIGMKMSMTLIPRLDHSAHSGHAELYFEAAAMIVVFLLAGRWAEARTRYRAGDALRNLLDLGAKEATLVTWTAAGRRLETTVPARSLKVDDYFLVRPGEKVATDGIVTEGASAIDTSLLTGESLPQDVAIHDDVTGGTINTWGALVVKATRVGEETTLAQIGRMVSDAQATKAPVQRLADRVSAVFVPIIIAISLLTLIVWIALGNPLQAAFTAAVSVLVVACPCALGLATPTALLVGSGRASQLGILIRNAEVLEQTRTITTAVLDKTGTVTSGVLSIDKVLPAAPDQDEESLLALGAAVEAGSEHPLAKAIYRTAAERGLQMPSISAFANHAGKGVSAGLGSGNDAVVLVGGSRWLAKHGIALPVGLADQQASFEDSGATVVAVVSAPASNFVANGDLQSGEELSTDSLEGLLDQTLEASHLAQVTMGVTGMTCASCVGRVERKLKKLPGVSAQVNLATETATITLDQDYSDRELEDVVAAAGYGGTVQRRENLEGAPLGAPDTPPQRERVLPEKITGAVVLGLIVLRDTIKPDSAEAIAELSSLGIDSVLLSGDNTAAARHVASQVGITEVRAEVLPSEKRDEVERLQNEGKTVVMIGDGVNDAAAMAQASKRGLGMAMGSGTDVAMAVADITLVNSDLRSAPRAIRISRKTLRVIKGNLFWAFFYNLLAVPLAVLGLLNPMIAAAAMAFSSVFVVANSLRLRTAG